MNKYMMIADEMAKQNLTTDNGGPFGAVVVKDGVVVGTGNNHVVRNNDPTAHIGFRDDKIYRCLNDVINGKKNDTVTLIPIDREETIGTFNDYFNKTDKTMY